MTLIQNTQILKMIYQVLFVEHVLVVTDLALLDCFVQIVKIWVLYSIVTILVCLQMLLWRSLQLSVQQSKVPLRMIKIPPIRIILGQILDLIIM